MTVYSYIVPRDYGFAPNPFNGFCTLATCKQIIRNKAAIGDWVIGTGSKSVHNIPGRMIYAMQVSEKLTFNQYWSDVRFQVKKAHLNGSLKQAFGDNIYYYDVATEAWHQENSHHSYEGGEINYNNLLRDTKYPYVLISNRFYYFGENHVEIPSRLLGICASTQGHKSRHDPKLAENFVKWLESNFEPGLHGNPLQFQGFERYHGIK